jgi:alkylhydroperoxidase family enzyme
VTIAAVKAGAWREHPGFSAAELTALEFAERTTATPPTVDATLVERLGEWFEPADIVEMAAIVAWENFRARFNCALGVEGHQFYQPKDG